jgi:hypothetical protein
MKLIIYSTVLVGSFLGEMCHAIELRELAGKFQLQPSSDSYANDKNIEIEITYFPNFCFEGLNETFEALKFGDEFISIIKDYRGRSQLSAARLEAKNPDLARSLDARESQDTVSSQPNAYTRMFLKVNDQNNFILSYTYKLGTIPIGPHIDLFPRWKKTPTKVIKFKRIQ